MKLPFLSFLQKKVPTEYFLALLLREEAIHAVVFEQVNGHIQVVGQGKSLLTSSIESISDDDLLDSADKAISFAEESLPDDIQTHKTVFGVKETWVSDMHITKNYLEKLKKVAQQLDLIPIGFLVFPEAIAHLLQKEEGAPVSAILIDAGEKQITMTLIRAGRIVETKEIPVQEDLIITVENGLKEFENVEIFPSRLILFDKGDSSVEGKFLSHHWSKSLPFLHVPQVTTLASDFDTRAILFGTATQMGFDAIDLIKSAPMKKQTFFEETTQYEEQHDRESRERPIIAREGIQGEQEENAVETQQNKIIINENTHGVTEKDRTEYFGFVKNADVNTTLTHLHSTPLPEEIIDEVTAEIPEVEREREEVGDAAYGFGVSGSFFVEGGKKIFTMAKRSLPKGISFNKVNLFIKNVHERLPVGGGLLFIIPLVVILFLAICAWYIFGLHAKVTLVLSPKVITQDQSVTFSTAGQTDPSTNTIAAQAVSVTEEGKVSGSATGNKDIGTPAKGTVTIFNSDNMPHTLDSGTIITSSNGLSFTLDQSVTVASGSSDPTNLSAGTADVAVTASAIGTDSNLPSETKFTISGTAVLAAKNSNAFSGGTKKSIVIVTQKDLDNLVTQLTNNLMDKAKADLASKIDNNNVILPEFTKTTATIKNFDKTVGDQASSINLDGTISYETVAYTKSDISAFAKAALRGKLPSNLILSPDGITYSVKDLSIKNGNANATLTMNASLIPFLDLKSLQNSIAGKPFSDARSVLSSVQQFSDSTFTLSPNFFFLPNVLPRLGNNITITVTTHE